MPPGGNMFLKKPNSGLRLAIRRAAELAGKDITRPRTWWYGSGKQFLAHNLGIKVQSINHWVKIPRDRLYMVHKITQLPLEVLAPDLFLPRVSRPKASRPARLHAGSARPKV